MRLPKRAWLPVSICFVAGLALLWLVLPPSDRYAVIDAIRYVIISWNGGDPLDLRMKRLAPSGVDCGRVPVRADPEPATRCVLEAFAARKSFRVRYDLRSWHSVVGLGLVGSRDGAVTALLFDPNPGDGGTPPPLQRMEERQCPVPVVLFRSPDGRLSCFPPDKSTW